jgi:hypothetical protein
MNPLRQPPTDPRGHARPASDLDQLLRDYFRAEMPQPWPDRAPALEPTQATRPPVRRKALSRSRFALAASLLFLLAGSLALSGLFSDYPVPAPDRTADRIIGANPHSQDKHGKPLLRPRLPNRNNSR